MTAPRFIVDTNIWLDHYIAHRPNHRAARAFVDAAITRGAQLLHASTTAKDVHYFIGAALKQDVRSHGGTVDAAAAAAIAQTAWSYLANMNDISTPVGIDAFDFRLAEKMRSFNDDLEDNLVMAAATRAKADYIVTRDAGLRKRSTVATLSPEDAVCLLSAIG